MNEDNYFDVVSYFTDVFSKNVDTWGFLVSYIDLVQEKEKTNNIQIEVARILSDFCFTERYAIKVIPVQQVASRLSNLNLFLDEM